MNEDLEFKDIERVLGMEDAEVDVNSLFIGK